MVRALEEMVEIPEHVVGNVDDAAPELGIRQLVLPIGPEVFRVKIAELAGRAQVLDVNAVRDARDGSPRPAARPSHVFQRPWLTLPWSFDTPFANRLVRKARIVMLNVFSGRRWPGRG